ncbi:MAG: hypothetical protein FD126_1324 [Elusimicrobia bacterium]|nr:MAG: hypothetical protein FD126_1324 [Elusimicrobiota bacterium]
MKRSLPGVAAAGLMAALLLGPASGGFGAPPLPFTTWSEEEGRIRREVRKAERAELVRPAPKGFKPDPTARKLKLTLVARDKTIRSGESFWYRLELQNVGREPVKFREEKSFLKNGWRYGGGQWEFYTLRPDGKKEMMIPGRLVDEMGRRERPNPPIDVPGSETMTEAQIQDWVQRDGLRRTAERDLEVVLVPGETLISRPWRWVTPEEQRERHSKGEKDLWPRPAGEFRELRTSSVLEQPGRHKIWVTYDDPPLKADEDEIQRMEKRGVSREKTLDYYRRTNAKKLGFLESNPVFVEVSP